MEESGEDTPTKPPRGVKQKQETSRLLMSTIQSLSNCKSDEQREKEKLKLERDYDKSNKKVDELVSKHYGELTRVMQAFARASMQITSSREKMAGVRRNLEECKVLLRCRREELRKLWLESVQHKHSLQLLEDIGTLREVPGQVGQLLGRKQFAEATKALNSGLALSAGELSEIEALREVHSELLSKQSALFRTLLEEVRYHLYVVPATDGLRFRRQGSGKEALSPFQRGISNLRGSKGARARRRLLEFPRGGGDAGDYDIGVEDEADGLDSKERAESWFDTIADCLCLLKKMHETVEILKNEMQQKLEEMIPGATREVMDNTESVGMEQGGQLLLDLVTVLLQRTRKVAASHALLLRVLTRSCSRHSIPVRLYDMATVWANVQKVLEHWLHDYIDSGAHEADVPLVTHIAGGGVPSSADISSYFVRRKPARSKRIHLFRFNRSLSSYSFAREQKESGRIAQTLVCSADIGNVTIVYGPLRELIVELQGTLPSSQPCTLQAFLDDAVNNGFLKSQHAKLAAAVAQATKDKDAWRAVTDPEVTKKLGLSKPLLQSTVVVEGIVVELRGLLTALPEFGEHILNILVHILSNYREVCQAAYRGIVQPDSEDKRIFSSAWLKDDDISRFLKSLPNWAELLAHKPTHRSRRLRREETGEEESPEDVRQRNVKEADMLASNIGEGGVQRSELLSDMTQLRKLAQLHESMEWLSAQILLVNGDLKSFREEGRDKCRIPEQTEQKLFQLVHEFTDLADICLMVLHLEVRVQCFHYLPSKMYCGQRNLTVEPDVQVTDLSKVLVAVHQVMLACLQPRKIKYIFEGIGHLISKILISTAQYMEKIDDTAIDRMSRNIVTLQQTLSHMTATRDLALDHAKSYFDLFHLTPDEVLAGIVERGASFNDMEYINALQVLHRSQRSHGTIKQHLERLSDILGETGVTV